MQARTDAAQREVDASMAAAADELVALENAASEAQQVLTTLKQIWLSVYLLYAILAVGSCGASRGICGP